MMGRNSSKRSPVCEKLLKALGVCPKIIKLGPQEEQPKPVGLARSYSRQIHVDEAPANIIAINNNNCAAPEMEKKQKPNEVVVGDHERKKEDVNDVFSDYISRAKRRLGSISSKKHDYYSSSSRGKENLKEDRRFSDYIIRARNKLNKATSSSVGRSKASSSVK